MPAEGVEMLKHHDILSFDEIIETITFGAKNGITKVRLTGGEPLVRKGIVNLVQMIANIDGIEDISMTTNGILLPKFANQLKKAGLMRVNISLDTLNADEFKRITRLGSLSETLDGINAAKEAGLLPIKLNCVIKNSSTEKNAQEVAGYAKVNGLQVRFIHEMNLETGDFKKVEGGEGGNCISCNRLRLTANGNLKPCLFSNLEFNVRKLGIAKAYELALNQKPKSGHKNNSGKFYNIGG